jgi:hypothetical protein
VGTKRGHWFNRALCALAAFCAATPALAASRSGTTNAVTLAPLSLVNISDLDFATNISGTTAGTITIDPTSDTRATTGGVTAMGGAPQAAKFFTYGTANKLLQVFRGPLPVLNRVGGGASMTVTGLTLNGPVTRFLSVAGLLDLRVGGTLAVAANQMDGVYTGTFQIIVNYQ